MRYPNSLAKAKITALGCYVPPGILTNSDLEKMVDTNDEWIVSRTGIRERHIASPEIATSDMAKAKITALGCYVPPGILTNSDLEKMVDTNDEWIVKMP